jgi:hypothetical protein
MLRRHSLTGKLFDFGYPGSRTGSVIHGAGSPRITRRTQESVAKTRWRNVWMKDHSPST